MVIRRELLFIGNKVWLRMFWIHAPKNKPAILLSLTKKEKNDHLF